MPGSAWALRYVGVHGGCQPRRRACSEGALCCTYVSVSYPVLRASCNRSVRCHACCPVYLYGMGGSHPSAYGADEWYLHALGCLDHACMGVLGIQSVLALLVTHLLARLLFINVPLPGLVCSSSLLNREASVAAEAKISCMAIGAADWLPGGRRSNHAG